MFQWIRDAMASAKVLEIIKDIEADPLPPEVKLEGCNIALKHLRAVESWPKGAEMSRAMAVAKIAFHRFMLSRQLSPSPEDDGKNLQLLMQAYDAVDLNDDAQIAGDDCLSLGLELLEHPLLNRETTNPLAIDALARSRAFHKYSGDWERFAFSLFYWLDHTRDDFVNWNDDESAFEEILNAIQEGLSLFPKESFPAYWADLKTREGDLYRKVFFGDRTEFTTKAIAAYEDGLLMWPGDYEPNGFAFNACDYAYLMLNSPIGDRMSNVQKAINILDRINTENVKQFDPDVQGNVWLRFSQCVSEKNSGSPKNNLLDAYDASQHAMEVAQRHLPHAMAEPHKSSIPAIFLLAATRRARLYAEILPYMSNFEPIDNTELAQEIIHRIDSLGSQRST